MAYNIMSCEGFGTELLGGCSMAWFGMAILFFIVVFTRKGVEMANMEFNSLGAFAGAYLPYIIIISLTGSAKFSMLGGIIGLFVGGLVLGMFMGGGESGYY